MRHLGMTFSSAFSVSLSLIFVSIFLLLSSNLNGFTINIEDQLSIRASVDTIVDTQSLDGIVSEIAAMEDVNKVIVSSGKEELEAYKKEYKDQNNLFNMYDSENSPIRDAILITLDKGDNIDKIAGNIEGIKGIVNAKYGGEETKAMIDMLQMIRNACGGFVIVMGLIALFLIANKIKMSIYTRKDEMAIMRFVGASNWCIKWPMIIEGLVIGVLGALLPIILSIIGYNALYTNLNGVLLSNMLILQSPNPLIFNISLLILGSGALIGMVGSLLSSNKYLHWKR